MLRAMSNPVLISCSFHLTIAADGTEFPADWDELSEVGRLIFEHLFYFLCSMLLKMLKVFQKVSRHIPSRLESVDVLLIVEFIKTQ